MEKLIYANKQYNIWQLTGKASLHELAEFVVMENYRHHVGICKLESLQDEIRVVYQEELQYVDSSVVFVVRTDEGKMIGSIRVFKWDKKKILPLQKLFGINPLTIISSGSDCNFWHIGRFAINSFASIPTLILFKQLMVYALHPIVCDDNSYMIAETDSKLLKVMNALGIKTVQLGNSINYLASKTLPICSSKSALLLFYMHYRNLYQAS